MNLIFVGPPGAGKGTQAKMVCEKYNIPHISTGDMLREAIRAGSKMGLKAKVLIDEGELVPDDVVVAIVKDRLGEKDCENGYVLDGFPRTVAQAQALEMIADIDYVIMVDVPEEKLVKRISDRRACSKCSAIYIASMYDEDICEICDGKIIQREDDREETVRNRLIVYNEKTSPLIDYYKERNLLKKIDGDKDIDLVFKDIIDIIG